MEDTICVGKWHIIKTFNPETNYPNFCVNLFQIKDCFDKFLQTTKYTDVEITIAPSPVEFDYPYTRIEENIIYLNISDDNPNYYLQVVNQFAHELTHIILGNASLKTGWFHELICCGATFFVLDFMKENIYIDDNLKENPAIKFNSLYAANQFIRRNISFYEQNPYSTYNRNRHGSDRIIYNIFYVHCNNNCNFWNIVKMTHEVCHSNDFKNNDISINELLRLFETEYSKQYPSEVKFLKRLFTV